MVNDLSMLLIMKCYVNVLTSLLLIVMKGLYSCNSYWSMMMMMFIQGLDPMTYIKLWWLVKTFQNGLSLAPSELDNGRWWLSIEEDSSYSSIWGVHSPIDTHPLDSHERRPQLPSGMHRDYTYLLVRKLCCPRRKTS